MGNLQGAEPDSTIKERIFEKVKRRMAELQEANSENWDRCPELNPDVIVISGDRTTLFEPQNRRVLEWFRQRYGTITEKSGRRNAIRVHPSLSRKIVDELKAAGFEVNS